jgi:hypothetical protein
MKVVDAPSSLATELSAGIDPRQMLATLAADAATPAKVLLTSLSFTAATGTGFATWGLHSRCSIWRDPNSVNYTLGKASPRTLEV